MANEKKQNQNSEEPLQYSLFGNPYSQQVSAPKEEVEKEVVKTNPYPTSAPYNPQPSTAAGYGAQTQGTIGIKGRPTTSTDPNAIQNVGGSALAPNKAEAVKDPVNYVEKFQKQQAEANKQYTPGTGGKGVSGWINRNFASPKSDGGGQTKQGNRQTIQNIAAISDVLRHAANLYYTSKGATPQNIQSQVAMNQAKWQAEDALEQQREKAQQEMELKKREQQRKEDKDERTLAQGDLRNQIALGNYNLALERDKRDADMHELNKTAKQAGIDKTKHDSELADKKFEEEKKQHGISNGLAQQRLALGWANHNLSAMRAARSGGGGGKSSGRSVGKKGDGSATFITPSGVRYTLSKNYQDNIGQVYDAMVKKGIIKGLTKTDSFGKPYQARPSKSDMINAVMKAADSRNGHDDFVWWGKKLGYQYVDGMTHDISNRVGGGMGYAGQSV